MAMVVWVMMGIAVWHFTVWLPDRFYGGIVGAFGAAAVAAAIFGFLVNGLTIPGQSDTDIVQAVIAVRLDHRAGDLVLVRVAHGPRDRHRPRPDARRGSLAARSVRAASQYPWDAVQAVPLAERPV